MITMKDVIANIKPRSMDISKAVKGVDKTGSKRGKLINAIDEQIFILNEEIAGRKPVITIMKKGVSKEKRLDRWFWQDVATKEWGFQIKYGKKVMHLNGQISTVPAESQKDIVEKLTYIKTAVNDGAFDELIKRAADRAAAAATSSKRK